MDTSNPPFWKWFVGGRLNASYNCVDRHLATDRNKAALIWVPEPEADETVGVTYQELYRRVNEFAALLRDFARLQAGDRVTFHLPMVPDLPVSMLACARLGVIHSQVFGGFSGGACGERIADSRQPGVGDDGRLLTAAASWSTTRSRPTRRWRRRGELGRRGGQGAGLAAAPGPVRLEEPDGRRAGTSSSTRCSPTYRDELVEPVSMPAEAPLFLMYTSGTTAQPKGCQHSTGGYLAYVTGTSKYYQDIHPNDTYWCMADIGWITGHSYIVYGPLSLGTTSVLYEGVPTYPDPGRPWRIAERLGVTIFHTAPTAIRMLRKLGPDEPAKYDHHFKHMTTVGEPIEPEVWRWYHESVGKGEAVVVDTWWQTENGGFLGSTLPGAGADETGQLRPGGAGCLPGDLRRARRGGPGGQRQGRQHLHPQPVAGHLPDDLGSARAVRADLLREVLPEPRQHRLAGLAVFRRGRGRAGRRRVLPDPRPGRRRDQRGRPPAGDQGAGIGEP